MELSHPTADQFPASAAHMVSPPKPEYEDCPQCDPCNPEMDEEGRPYTCYCCGDTGRVLKGC